MAEKNLVLIGGGHSHILLMKKMGMKPIKGLNITLVTPDPELVYTGMLPAAILGAYNYDQIKIDLIKLSKFAKCKIVFSYVNKINLQRKEVYLGERNPLEFDVLSIDIGINYQLTNIHGSEKFSIPVKPFDKFIHNWSKFLLNLKAPLSVPKISIIGAGAAGCELALCVNYKIKSLGFNPKVYLIEKNEIAGNLPNRAKNRILKLLDENNIILRKNINISSITKGKIHCEDGEIISSDFILRAAGGIPQNWLSNTDLNLEKGFISINQCLQSTSHDFVFASGDCASIVNNPNQKAGVFAVRAAPFLYRNIKNYISSKKLIKYNPQKNFLQALTIDKKKALLFRGNFSINGIFPWLFKDFVDRSFIKKFYIKNSMNSLSKEKYREQKQDLCGACGAKIGNKVLENALEKLPIKVNGMLNKIGDDAAIVNLKQGNHVLTTDHLREFCSDPWTMSRITAIHSLGDIWAMGSVPSLVLSHIIIPDVPLIDQQKYLSDIIDAANSVFKKEGASIIGGHTSKGKELTIGFTILGHSNKNPITLDGANHGDLIILTKPIGTGTILAGEMQGLAKGLWIKNAQEWMMKSQGSIIKFLSNKVTSMTDVTGFGLYGHLKNICKSSNVSAILNLDEIPILEGALELSLKGVRSTIFEDNLLQAYSDHLNFDNKKWPLLFDPQTSGGLLASVPKKHILEVQKKLEILGLTHSVIGKIVKGKATISY